MISITELRKFLDEFTIQEAIFSPSLDGKTRALMQKESAVTFAFFASLLKKFDGQEVDTRIIREYLAIRWRELEKTNLAYTRHPFLPVNQLCLKVAEWIAEPKEAVCTILMPSVSGLNRKHGALKLETEEDGHFAPEKFILDQHDKRLIPVEEIFIYAEMNTNYVIPDYQADSSELQYGLGGRDFLNLERIVGAESEEYLQAIKKKHELNYNNNSIGFVIKRLATELHKGSVADAGIELVADDEVFSEAIKTFYNIWQNLAAETREKVNEFRIRSYGYKNYNLESYFLALFVRHKDCPVSEAERARQKKEDIFPCAKQLSDYLNEFLVQNPKLYEIPFHAHSATEQFEESSPDLKHLLKKALTALQIRPQTVDGCDDGLLPKLVRLMLLHHKLYAGYSLVHIAAELEPMIQSYQDLIDLFEVHKSLFFKVTHLLQLRLGKLEDSRNIIHILEFLPEEQQQIILDGQFEVLFIQNRQPSQYSAIIAQLAGATRENFKRCYIQKLVGEIHTYEDLARLAKEFSSLFNEVVEFLKPLYITWLDTYGKTLAVLPMLSDANQCEALSLLSKQLLTWITPDNYNDFHYKLNLKAQNAFSKIIKQSISANVITFDQCMEVLRSWKSVTTVALELLDQFNSLFKTATIVSGDYLLSLLREFRLSAVLKHLLSNFSSLLTEKQLFLDGFALMPNPNLRELYLADVSAVLFVNSISSLQEVLKVLKTEKERNIFFSQFDHLMLNCSIEEFHLLTHPKSNAATKLIADLSEFIEQRRRCESYFFLSKSSDNPYVQIANALLEKLHESCSNENLLALLNEALAQIEKKGSRAHSSESPLYKLIDKYLFHLRPQINVQHKEEKCSMGFRILKPL